jgi:tetratricopeptide (TPR) repeat protein
MVGGREPPMMTAFRSSRSMVSGIGRAAAFAAMLGACAGAPPPPEPPPIAAPTVVPAGVDSAAAVHADSVADASFVSLAQQEQAAALQEAGRAQVERSDSIWAALTARADSLREVTADDSARAQEAVATGGETLLELDRLLRESDLEAEALARQTSILLDSAQAALETAYALNPFDPRSKLWLSRVYELQARRLGRAEAYQQAIDELEKLTRLTPDQHSVFALLANNYYFLEDWGAAAENYERAAVVYEATYDLVPAGTAAFDTSLVFTYMRAEADMHVRRHDTERAEVSFRRALRFAQMPEDSAYIDGELAWMGWDDGNIASSFARDSLMAMEQAGELGAARAGYVALLPTLSAARAVDETEWRLAIVDYNLGHAEEAALRLHDLVRRTPVDSAGVPLDSTAQRYLDDYGTICLNVGRDFLHEQRDNRTALKYFEQASRVTWAGQGVAYLEVATLVQGNVTLATASASQALEREADLSLDERRTLYQLLMGLYRRTGDFDAARRFRDAIRILDQQGP